MRIDPSIYQMIDDGLITVDDLLAQFEPLWLEAERRVLATATADGLAKGFSEADVRRVIESQKLLLERDRPGRLATVRAQLEARATWLQ